jgi:6-phosphofructokinase
MTKRIGILTSGGDCAGLNATIRAVALRAHHGHGWTTVGLRYGTLGLLERPVEAVTLDPDRLSAALARQGGTFLGSTNRGNPFSFPMPDGSRKDRSAEMVEGLKQLGLDGLIGVGGDGSLAILRKLLDPSGIPFVGIPKTIDNDVDQTERAIGYSTAVAIATEALDPPAADRRQPRAHDGAGGDGPGCRSHRHRGRHRRRRRRRVDPRGSVAAGERGPAYRGPAGGGPDVGAGGRGRSRRPVRRGGGSFG